MKLHIEVCEDEFAVYFLLNFRRVKLGVFPFEPDNGYITPCFTYSFLWALDRTVVVCFDEADTEVILHPGDNYECKHEASMEDPSPEES